MMMFLRRIHVHYRLPNNPHPRNFLLPLKNQPPMGRGSLHEVLVHPSTSCIVPQHPLRVPLQSYPVLALRGFVHGRVVVALHQPVLAIAHGFKVLGEGTDPLVVVAVDLQLEGLPPCCLVLLLEPPRERRIGHHVDLVTVPVVVVVVDVLDACLYLRRNVEVERSSHRHIEHLRSSAESQVRNSLADHLLPDQLHLQRILSIVDVHIPGVLVEELVLLVVGHAHFAPVRLVLSSQIVSFHHQNAINASNEIGLELLGGRSGAGDEDRDSTIPLKEVDMILPNKINLLVLP
mmetsp:Transcript_31234/g.70278  ORF Transcript_31234/g.70278 Transcript_31234/m.70278 type:complete len:290 (+) Transcript_31234:228-1097(+)